MGSDGSIYIADSGTPIISKFDRTGKFLRVFGGKGAGPGEYGSGNASLDGQNRGAEGVALLRDGRVVVHSKVGNRILAYSAAGVPLATINQTRLDAVLGGGGRQSQLVVVDSANLIYARMSILPPGFRRTPAYWDAPRYYLRLRGDGRIVDTLAVPLPPKEPALLTLGDRGAPRVRHVVPFTGEFSWALSPRGYFVSGWSDDAAARYAVDLRISPRGSASPWQTIDPVISLRVPYKPVPVTPGERADWTAAFTATYKGYDKAWKWNGPSLPERKPAFKELWVDDDGRIWVHRYAPASEDRSVAKNQKSGDGEPRLWWARDRWPELPLYDVIEPNGRFVGQVQASETIYPQAARGDTLWAIVDGEDGPMTVKRYRIHWKR